jgi:exosome complex RNA-binding protein Csl4
MTAHRRTRAAHTDWCARDHRCNLAEHRSTEIVIDLPGAGRVVLTRVRGSDGADHAEIRMRIVLPDHEPAAHTRLVSLLTHLRTLIGPARQPERKAA